MSRHFLTPACRARNGAHHRGRHSQGNLRSRSSLNGCVATIDAGRGHPGAMFAEIERRAGLRESEMYRVFNMGIGFVVVVEPAGATEVV